MNKAAIIDPRASDDVKENLAGLGLEIIPIPLTDLVAEPVSGHPDIQVFIHGNNAFMHPDISADFIRSVEQYCNVTVCTTGLDSKYPLDIPYNIACIGNIAIHKKDCTAPEIKKYLSENNINLIHTSQGYSKCSTLIVDNNSLITSDKSIHKSAETMGIDSLLITTGYIDLPGYNYGFIGGASGEFNNTVFFAGRIDHHPDFDRIKNFIISKEKSIIYLSENRADDIGSILFI
jgi:hypothetical protein